MPTLHITNGDCVRGTLRTIVSDPIAITADPLHEGPAPANLSGDEWRAVRARHSWAASDDEYRDALRTLTEWDQEIADAPEHDEVVLWFEHDLFDQLLLIRTLDLLASNARVSLICIGEFPGVQRFVGLGQLDGEQLASLLPQRQPVTAAQYELATEAWNAFRAADPSALISLERRLKPTASTTSSADATSPLPFLGEALTRFFAEFPSVTTGLSRTEETALQVLAAGPLTGLELFPSAQAREARPFMGDCSFFGLMRDLADARVPLVTVDGVAASASRTDLDLRHCSIAITEAGRDVLAGRADAVKLNGIDCWRGGVHLAGAVSPWRWDLRAETLVS